jgi:hypothetical protein
LGSPPYLHEGRLLTPENTVEFFNLISTQTNIARKGSVGGVPLRLIAEDKHPLNLGRDRILPKSSKNHENHIRKEL